MAGDGGYRGGGRTSPRRVMDDDSDELLDQCAACGCSVCLLDEQFADGGRRPVPRPPGPTAALPARRAARYPFLPS